MQIRGTFYALFWVSPHTSLMFVHHDLLPRTALLILSSVCFWSNKDWWWDTILDNDFHAGFFRWWARFFARCSFLISGLVSTWWHTHFSYRAVFVIDFVHSLMEFLSFLVCHFRVKYIWPVKRGQLLSQCYFISWCNFTFVDCCVSWLCIATCRGNFNSAVVVCKDRWKLQTARGHILINICVYQVQFSITSCWEINNLMQW